MSAMFPASGVPASDAKNSLPDPNTVNCQELWHSTSRCQPRFDPASANAVISELVNLINRGEVVYDCNFLDNVELSVRYLIQRGIPCAAVALQVFPATPPFCDYNTWLDPKLTRYNDFLTLVIVPNFDNTGQVRINIDGLGLVPLLRTDGQQLVAGDLSVSKPYVVSFYGGSFYLDRLTTSQVLELIAINRVGVLYCGYAYTANDYTITLTPSIASLQDFVTIAVIPTATNTGSVTLNVSGLGARTLYRNDGQVLQASDFRSSIPYLVTFCNGSFYMVSPCASQSGGGNVIYYGGNATAGGPADYTVIADAAVASYYDYLTLVVYAAVNNSGSVRLNVNGLGLVPLLRTDGQQLAANDIKAFSPFIVSYLGTTFFMSGLAQSQVPVVVPISGSMDCWVRTDGNDANDGTANTPASAFRTIQGCWNKIGATYAASPMFTINIRLGIPGDYEGASLGPFGGNMSLIGDTNNKNAYRILSVPYTTDVTHSLQVTSANLFLQGVTLTLNRADAFVGGAYLLRMQDGSSVLADNCRYEIAAQSGANPSCIIRLEGASSLSTVNAQTIDGNGFSLSAGIYCYSGNFAGCAPGQSSPWTWNNVAFDLANTICHYGSMTVFGNCPQINNGCTGVRYNVSSNGVLYLAGQTLAGSLPGSQTYGGQVLP